MNRLVEHFNKTFLKGLLTVVPVALTIFVCIWLISSLENTIGGAIKEVVPEALYIPGMGVIIGVSLLYLVGLLAKAWLFRKIVELGESLLRRLPFVKNIYSSVKEIANLFDAEKGKEMGRVVAVEIGDFGFTLIGFVTQANSQKLPPSISSDQEQKVAVYLPMSYQLGGFTIFVDPKELTEIDMSVDKAMQYVLTAGVTSEKE